MALKLFRNTEFADSSQYGVVQQRLASHPFTVAILASLWLAGAGNLALWRALTRLPELDNWRGLAFAIGFALMIASVICALLALLSWRWTFKPAVTLFLFAAAAGAHYMLAYGIVIDTTMMVNVLQTDMRETRELLGWQLLLTLVVLAVLPCVWLWRHPLRRVPVLRAMWQNAALFAGSCLLLVALLFAVFQDFASLMRNQLQLRYLINPLNAFYALAEIAAQPLQRTAAPPLPIGQDSRLGASHARSPKPPLLVLVLGETARSVNFGINGYARVTTPKLAGERLASWRNAWSCGTSTAASVPCMFSHLGRVAYEARDSDYFSLLDVLQQAGLGVLWLDNQSGCKGLCDRVASANTRSLSHPTLCTGGECLDEIMLDGLDARIAALDPQRRARGVVLVLHQMGSHGPAYFKRSPPAFKRFRPECGSNALQDCSREQVLNAYDNTILYTDHFLHGVITWLKAREASNTTAMLYVSDHGESLGENNLYLHGLPYAIAPDVQKQVPWITWFSSGFEQRRGIGLPCVQARADERVSHDNFFHSVLGLMDVQAKVYQSALDPYAACYKS